MSGEPLIRGNLTVSNSYPTAKRLTFADLDAMLDNTTLAEHCNRRLVKCRVCKPRNAVPLLANRDIGINRVKPYVELERFRLASMEQQVYVGLSGDRISPLVRHTWREGPFNWQLALDAMHWNGMFIQDWTSIAVQYPDYVYNRRPKFTNVCKEVRRLWRFGIYRNKRRYHRYRMRDERGDGDPTENLYVMHLCALKKRSAKVRLYNLIRRLHAYRVPNDYLLEKRILTKMNL